MNYNLLALLTFFVVLVVLFWIIPSKKGKEIASNLTLLFKILPVGKIADAIIKYFENKNK